MLSFSNYTLPTMTKVYMTVLDVSTTDQSIHFKIKRYGFSLNKTNKTIAEMLNYL